MTYGFATALALDKNFQQLVFSLLSSGSTDFFLTMFTPFSYFSLGTIQSDAAGQIKLRWSSFRFTKNIKKNANQALPKFAWKIRFYAYVRKTDSNFLAVFVYTFVIYGYVKKIQTWLGVFIYFSKVLLLVEFCLLTQRLPRLLCLNISSIKNFANTLCKQNMSKYQKFSDNFQNIIK